MEDTPIMDKTTLTRINNTAQIAGSVFTGLLAKAPADLSVEQLDALKTASILHADDIYKKTITYILSTTKKNG